MGRTRGGNTRRGRKSSKDDYKSDFERIFCKTLETRHIDFGYETEKINYKVERTYNPDVILQKQDGSIMYLELKGFFDKASQNKMKWVKQTNPELDIRMIFMDSSKKIHKGAKMDYAGWCRKYGYKFADKNIPSAWVRELATNNIKQ